MYFKPWYSCTPSPVAGKAPFSKFFRPYPVAQGGSHRVVRTTWPKMAETAWLWAQGLPFRPFLRRVPPFRFRTLPPSTPWPPVPTGLIPEVRVRGLETQPPMGKLQLHQSPTTKGKEGSSAQHVQRAAAPHQPWHQSRQQQRQLCCEHQSATPPCKPHCHHQSTTWSARQQRCPLACATGGKSRGSEGSHTSQPSVPAAC